MPTPSRPWPCSRAWHAWEQPHCPSLTASPSSRRAGKAAAAAGQAHREPASVADPSTPTLHLPLQEKQPLPAEYIENQKAVDGPLLAGLSAELKGYLATRFTLRSGDRPHLLKF